MQYKDIIFKIPKESNTYEEDSRFVITQIVAILAERKIKNENKIILNTNLKLGLPLENINKIAGPMVEAWAFEVFSGIRDIEDNNYSLVNVEAQQRLNMSDIILQFKKGSMYLTGSVDVKATAEDIPSSGKGPNITSFSRIRSAYIQEPDYMFIILSLKHKVVCLKNAETGLMDGIMEIVDFHAYDLKFLNHPCTESTGDAVF